MIKCYKTIDGKVFDSSADASDHEDTLFNDWMRTNPRVPSFYITAALANGQPREYFGTPASVFKQLMREYYETTVRKIG